MAAMRWGLLGLLGALALGGTAVAQPAHAPSGRAQDLLSTGRAYLAAGDRGSAIGYFREAVQADPRAAEAYVALGDAYRQRRAFSDARAVLEAGLLRNADHPGLWLALAETQLDAGAPEEALRALRSLLARQPSHVEALRMRARLARVAGAWSEALTATRALLALPDDAGLVADDRRELMRYEAALRLLARPLDPVSAARACSATPIRRALARCGD